MSKVYIASPLFTERQRENVNEIARFWATAYKFDTIYKPQDFQVPNAWELPNSDWADAVEAEDRLHLDSADIVIGILYGMNGDDGTAWEIGYASAKGKRIVLVFMNEGGTYSLMMKNVATRKILRKIFPDNGKSKFLYEDIEDKEIYWS